MFCCHDTVVKRLHQSTAAIPVQWWDQPVILPSPHPPSGHWQVSVSVTNRPSPPGLRGSWDGGSLKSLQNCKQQMSVVSCTALCNSPGLTDTCAASRPAQAHPSLWRTGCPAVLQIQQRQNCSGERGMARGGKLQVTSRIHSSCPWNQENWSMTPNPFRN